ncbi:ankyrin repeat domain-containing protein [Pseudomonas lopnurensis]|uniref:ankyrin repeat domain-containing protein n=1 Tax=Pseudomonas lopnurensis TaxID=1477517 RepID=UPI0028AF7C86|nr:ankyrin repeat domain-containing protein [Pseudomonas lopnurensis]
MSQAPKQTPELDDATLAFAEQVFDSARAGDSARLGELLAQGMPANLRNHAGDSLLMLASYHGHLQATRTLLEYGADIEGRCEDGKTALMMAAMFNRTEIVEYLVAHGADPRATDASGATPLAAATMMGATDTQVQLRGLLG